jgi:antirestriction protein ArdC
MTTPVAAQPEVLERLTEGIAHLTSSEEWISWLNVQRRFHRYSFQNTLLIAQQRPDATRVAGFHTWRGVGRAVRKGSKGIQIIAPVTRKRQVEGQGDDDPTTIKHLVGFKVAYVFAYEDTDGEPLTDSPCQRLDGEDPDGAYAQLVEVAHTLGYTVEEDFLPGERNGDCNFVERRIRVEVSNSPAQQVKTLAHEIGHALMHEDFTNRELAELEAESVAFIVCEGLQLDTSRYSFGYVANWAGGGDEAIKNITASGNRIQLAAKSILDALERLAVAA